MTPPIGHHILLDLHDCECEGSVLVNIVHSLPMIKQLEALVHPLWTKVHQFEPHGWSALVMLEESHFSIHTWPMQKFVSCDFFTCSGKFEEEAVKLVVQHFKAHNAERMDVQRGCRPLRKATGFFNVSVSAEVIKQGDGKAIR